MKVIALSKVIEQKINDARNKIQQADALVNLAGAGMGVGSGLPGFRGKDGCWREYPVLTKKYVYL